MFKETVGAFGKKMVEIGVRNSPNILVGLGVAGVVTTAVLAGKFAIEAKPIVNDAKEKVNDIQEEPIPEEEKKKKIQEVVVDTAKKVVPKAVPVVIAGTATVGCILGGHTINLRRQAMLAAAYELSQSKILEDERYIAKAKEILGKDKDIEIRKEVKDEAINDAGARRPYEKRFRCRDGVRGGVCYATKYEIQRAFLNIERDILYNNGFTPLNDLYDYLNMPNTDEGSEVGWNPGDDPMLIIEWVDDGTSEPELVFRYKAYKDVDAIHSSLM